MKQNKHTMVKLDTFKEGIVNEKFSLFDKTSSELKGKKEMSVDQLTTLVERVLEPLVEIIAANPSPVYVLDVLTICGGFISDATKLLRAKQDVKSQQAQNEIDTVNLEQREINLLSLTTQQVIGKYS